MIKAFFQKFSAKQKKITLLIVGLVFLLFFIGLGYGLSIRGRMLDQAMLKAEQQLSEKYNIDFKVRKYSFSGMTTVAFDQIDVTPRGQHQLAAIEQMSVSVRIWPLLFGDVKLGDLNLKNAKISLVKKDSVSNYDFLFKKKNKDTLDQVPADARNYAALIDGVLKKVFFKIPSDMEISNFELSYQDDSTQQRIRLPQASIDGGDFETSLFLNDHDAQWNLVGKVNPDRQALKVQISSEQKDVELPLLRRKFGLQVSFDELMFDLNKVVRQSKDSLQLMGGWSFVNLKVKHNRLSNEQIVLPEANGEGQINIGKEQLEVAKNSQVRVKEFAFSPYLKFVPGKEKIVELSIHTGKFEAQHFFDALPKGLFETLDGVQVAGEMAYNLDFKVNFSHPDQLEFNSTIDDDALKVVQWGNANIRNMNTAFTYTAYEDTLLMREIVLGTQNPKYTPLNEVSSILKKTVLNTEDPYFYKHQGFEEEAFKLSIATNIKERKFKRGASTISMQLVKNVFLTRNKHMMRKLEEILLVWLMESSKEVSKDRLFEVYLNVIEWGKNIYGIQEAANYYFGVQPKDLSLGQSLYLSSIIPRPKTGLGSFDYTGHLKPWVQKHFNTYGYIMNKRNQLTDETVPGAYGFYEVLVQQGLRPARPQGLVDTSFQEINEEQEAIMRELEADEAGRKSLLEKLFGKDITKEEKEVE